MMMLWVSFFNIDPGFQPGIGRGAESAKQHPPMTLIGSKTTWGHEANGAEDMPTYPIKLKAG